MLHARKPLLTLMLGLGVTFLTSASSCDPRSRFPAPPLIADQALRRAALKTEIARRTPVCVDGLVKRFGKEWPRSGTGFAGLDVKLTRENAGCGDTAGGCTEGNGDEVTVYLREELFLTGYQELGLTLCHELTHAYFRRFMDRGDYADLPNWAREGLAVYVAGQLESKINQHLFDKNVLDPTKGINGLEGDHGFGDYFEDALAFAWMESKAVESSYEILNSVLNGEDIFASIARILRVSKGRFLAEAKEYARNRMLALAAALPPSLRDGESAMKRNDFRGAQSAYENTLRSEGVRVLRGGQIEGQLTPAAGYAIWRLAFLLTHHAIDRTAAGDFYRALLTRVPPDYFGRQVAAVRYDSAYIALKARRGAEALDSFARVFSEHIESPMLQLGAAMGITRTYFETGDYRNALVWLESNESDGTFVDEEVLFMTGVSYFQTCQRDHSIRILKKLTARPPTHAWVRKGIVELEAIRSGTRTAPACP